MITATMSRAVLALELQLRRLNPWLLATVMVWLLALGLWALAVPARQGELLSITNGQARSGIIGADATSRAPAAELPAAAAHLKIFLDNLGDSRYTEQQLQSLFVIARGLSLELPQGKYRMACEAGASFCKYQIELPIKGPYVRVRIFIEDLLMVIPFASLDDLSFRRETANDDEIEVRLAMTLFTRNAAAASVGPAGAKP
jgi:hypothetical protein